MSNHPYAFHVYGLVLPATEAVAAAIYATVLNPEWQTEIAPNAGIDPNTVPGAVAFDALHDSTLDASDLCEDYPPPHAPLDPTEFVYAMCDHGAWGNDLEQFVLAYPMKLASGEWADEEAAFPGRRAAVEAALQQVRTQLQSAGLECPAPEAWLLQTYA